MDSQSYNSESKPKPKILRIKRQRNDEPHDALVLEPSRKRFRTASDVFQFVGTAESDDFLVNPHLDKELIARATSAPNNLSFPPIQSSKAVGKQPEQTASSIKRYIVQKAPSLGDGPKQHESTLDNATDEPIVYDAVLADPEKTDMSSGKKGFGEMESLIEGLLEMGHEKLSNAAMSSETDLHAIEKVETEQSEQDCVFDYYIQRPRPANWVDPKNVGHIDPSSVSFLLLTSEEPQSSEDDDDEDSNAEGYYANDYPDEDPDENSEHSLEDYDHESEQESFEVTTEEIEKDEDEDESEDYRDFLHSRGIRG